jgi:hypothetical protein
VKKKILTVLIVVLFGAAGALIGRIAVRLTGIARPLVDDYWTWLGPFIGLCIGLGLLWVINYTRTHRPPEQ